MIRVRIDPTPQSTSGSPARPAAVAILLVALWAGSAVAAPEPEPTPLILNCGVSLEERLLQPGQVKRYAVQVTEGATVAVNVSDTSDTIGLIKLRTSDEDETCSGTLMLTQPGTAIVEVSDCLGEETGSYTIAAHVVSEVGTCGSRPLACGATLRIQSFAIAGEVDAYTFIGAPGDQVTMTARGVSDTIGFVRLRLFDPDGQLVTTADSCESSNMIVTLEKAGQHTALASACGLPTTGNYGVALESTWCPTGPDVTYLGIASADGTVLQPSVYDYDGRPLYELTSGADVWVVIEARPGSSGEAVGVEAFQWDPDDPAVLPDLQVLISKPLGDGSAAVCDEADPTGGVPGTDPLEYTPTQPVADAINDFGCRVDDGSGESRGVTDSAAACTRSAESAPAFFDPTTTVQFCAPIDPALAFPPGGATLKARLRDAQGTLGAERDMIIRVPRPEPCPVDCNGDGQVVINELVLSVQVALGNATTDLCEAADANADGSVQINEIIQGMNAALLGCTTG